MLQPRLFKLLTNEKKYIVFVSVLNILSMILNLLSTAFVVYFIWKQSIELIPLLLFALLLILKLSTTLLSHHFNTKLSTSVKRGLREAVYTKLLKLGLRDSKESLSSITQLSIEGIEQLNLYFGQFVPQFFFATISPILLFTLCCFIEWKTALILLGCVPIIPIVIIGVSKYAKRIFAKYWGQYTSMGDSFLDAMQGMKELKIFNVDEAKQKETAERSEEFRKITMKVLIMQLASIVVMDLVAFGGAAIAIAATIGSALETGPSLSPFLALFLILISAEFFLPLRALGSAFHVAMNGVTAGNKLLDFMEFPEPVWGNETIAKEEAISEININNLSFQYENNDTFALSNIQFSFKKGFNIIQGESGSGKSTLFNLILGSLRPSSGEVQLVAGAKSASLHQFSQESYYNQIAVVSSQTYIFNISLRENFQLANPNVTDDEILLALKRVNLKEEILELGGLDKIIMEESENISGGQKQRLALAINLTQKKSLYLFDEATSNIDSESEAIIMNEIHQLAKEKIVILVSHRQHNWKESQASLLLEKGGQK